MTDVEYLTLEDLLTIVERLDAQIRDLGLLASAAARPRTTVFGEDAYPDLGTKAAALMHSLARESPAGRREQAAGLDRHQVCSWH